MNLPIIQIHVGPRHRRDHGDITGLAASIADIGLLHPIVVRPDNTLISGERRLKAVESLGWADVPIRVVEGLEDTLRALKAETDENICRKDFLPSEAVVMGLELEKVEAPEAKERQASTLFQGDKEPRCGNLPPRETGKTRDKVGAAVGMSGKTYEKAKEVVEAAEAEPEKYQPLLDAMNRTGKVNGVHKRLRTSRAAESISKESPPLPTGPFRVIAADPPWLYGSRADDASHRAANPYPSMTIDAIKAMPVEAMAHDDAVLWLWTTNAHLRESFEVAEAWGFTYKTTLTWVKPRMGTGDWLRGRTEHCLLCVRGKPTITLTNQTTGLEAPAGRHSEKPEAFYELVEAMCPGGKVELFARRKRKGWHQHGNEA